MYAALRGPARRGAGRPAEDRDSEQGRLLLRELMQMLHGQLDDCDPNLLGTAAYALADFTGAPVARSCICGLNATCFCWGIHGLLYGRTRADARLCVPCMCLWQ